MRVDDGDDGDDVNVHGSQWDESMTSKDDA